jgi:hypothetical protein
MNRSTFRRLLFKFKNKNYSTTTTATTTTAAAIKNDIDDIDLLNKLESLNLKKNLLKKSTLERIKKCSLPFLNETVQNLNQFGFDANLIHTSLNHHYDWTRLSSKQQIESLTDMFRRFSLKNEVYSSCIAMNSDLLDTNPRKLEQRLNEMKYFFTKRHLNQLLIRSPQILTTNIDDFHYKFTYIFVLMVNIFFIES